MTSIWIADCCLHQILDGLPNPNCRLRLWLLITIMMTNERRIYVHFYYNKFTSGYIMIHYKVSPWALLLVIDIWLCTCQFKLTSIDTVNLFKNIGYRASLLITFDFKKIEVKYFGRIQPVLHMLSTTNFLFECTSG